MVINNGTWNQYPTATDALTAGWHYVELRFGQGGGGGGVNGTPTYGGYGIAYEAPGSSTWTQFADPGNGTSLLASLPTGNSVLPTASPVSIAAGATLDINGVTQPIGSLTGAGSVINSSTTAGLLIDGRDGTSGTFSGVLAGNTGNPAALAFSKEGSGTLTLTSSNQYTGTTLINNGGLTLAGSGTLAAPLTLNAGQITVLSGGQFTLDNTGVNNTARITGGTTAGLTLSGGAQLPGQQRGQLRAELP